MELKKGVVDENSDYYSESIDWVNRDKNYVLGSIDPVYNRDKVQKVGGYSIDGWGEDNDCAGSACYVEQESDIDDAV